MVALDPSAAQTVENWFDEYKRQTGGDVAAAAALVLARSNLEGRSRQSPPESLLKVADAAERLKVSPRTVYRLCDDGKLPYLNVGSGRGSIRIRPDDLAAFQRNKGATRSGKRVPRVTLAQLRAV